MIKNKLSLFLTLILLLSLSTSLVSAKTNENTISKSIDEFTSSKIVEIDNLINVQLEYSTATYSIEDIKQKAHKIHQEVDEYLSKQVSKQTEKQIKNSYKKISDLADKLDDLDLLVNELESSNSLAPVTYSGGEWRYGDILYYGIGNNSAIGEPSFTGHTGVLSTVQYYVIEASKTTNNGAKVHHWNRDNLWSGCSGVKQYKVVSWLGADAAAYERYESVQYGLDQVGEPYALKTSLVTDDKWYCSKLTYRQWLHTGYDLKGPGSFIIGGYLLVIPDDIRLDANTRLYKDWGTSTPDLTY